jgi:hypothetical protein
LHFASTGWRSKTIAEKSQARNCASSSVLH